MAPIEAKPTLQHNTFLGRQVFATQSDHPLGQVTDLWIDLRQHRVLGFSCRAGFWDLCLQTYAWKQIETLDEQRIEVQSSPVVHPTLILSLNAETGMAVRERLDLGVWTQQGDRLGEITDFSFNASTGTIDYYFLAPHTKRDQTPELIYLASSMIVDGGQGWLQVPDQYKQQLEPEAKNLNLLPWQVAFAS
ncbi:PRC-barrel domain-containing protein [Acaryochloris sp. CCMEE 5410]|uniref:PRC-barrel domain-containing protein n=1 Tax=Acaryochloris sp. CCMEE 5410 TaxID=310037 RepID=UPI0002483CBE|nr:PRC-barrel domain-containing protein [Acaryochloris sp. CCMEE 5410]KAI9134405.1 PRC-barrel domain-containing protein [Acaryochloris sp. CCMEE 5410]